MKKLYIFILAMAVCSLSLFGQTEKVINVGDDLIVAIESSADGDIFVLKPGIHVANDRNMVVNHNLTIKGEEGSEMPKVYISQFNVSANGQSFKLEGLEITGMDIDSLTGTEYPDSALIGDYVMNLVTSTLEPTDAAYNTFGTLTFQSCHVRNITRSAIRGDRDTYTAQDIIVDDCIMHDFRAGGNYGPFRLKSRIQFNSFKSTNSTFYDVPRAFYDCQDMPSHATIYQVENCTFYNWGGQSGGGKYLFDINNNDQGSLIIKNCILGKTMVDPNDPEYVAYGFRFMEEAYAEIGFTAMTPDFIIPETRLGYTEALWDKDEYNTVDLDPQWADPDNGDFTLPEGSPLLQMSPDGTIIGDPRWDPNYGVGIANRAINHEVSVYPNPAADYINVALSEQFVGAELTILDVSGRLIHTEKCHSAKQRMDVSGLQPGIYLFKADMEGSRSRTTFVIE